jgi:hypothetical protein
MTKIEKIDFRFVSKFDIRISSLESESRRGKIKRKHERKKPADFRERKVYSPPFCT